MAGEDAGKTAGTDPAATEEGCLLGGWLPQSQGSGTPPRTVLSRAQSADGEGEKIEGQVSWPVPSRLPPSEPRPY